MSATRAVIFDLFGTLVRPWPEGWTAEFNRAFAAALSIDPEEFGAAWRADFDARMTTPLEEGYRRVCERLGRALPSSEVLARIDARRIDVTRERLMGPRPDAVPTLARLGELGLPVALVSDCSSEVTAIWSESPLAPHIRVPVFSCSVGLKKPDPRIFALACDALGVAPADCLYVGDGGSDELRGASALGMRAVLLRPGDTLDASWPGAAIGSLGEVLTLLSPDPEEMARQDAGRERE